MSRSKTSPWNYCSELGRNSNLDGLWRLTTITDDHFHGLKRGKVIQAVLTEAVAQQCLPQSWIGLCYPLGEINRGLHHQEHRGRYVQQTCLQAPIDLT